MLSLRAKIIVGLLIVILVVVIGASSYTQYKHGQEEYSEALLLLQTPDANVRTTAAETVLLYEPEHIDARLIHAREMFARGRYRECYSDVTALPASASPDQLYEATVLGAHSLIKLARNTISMAPSRGVDTIAGQVTELLAQIAAFRQIIETSKRDPLVPLTIRAMEVDTRAMYLRLAMQSLSTQLSLTRAASLAQEIDVLSVHTSDDELELKLLDQELNDLCQKAIRIDSLAALPRVLLIQRYFRHGEVSLARESVQMLTQRKEIPVELAVEVAGDLLNLEQQYFLETTEVDVELAQQVLALAGAGSESSVELQFVTAELKLAQGHAQEAYDILQKALASPNYVGNNHGVCLRARVLITLGRAGDAEQMLARLNDRNPSWESKYQQGMALIAMKRAGLDLFRQAQEMNSDNLQVRLAICRTMVAVSGYEVAEFDIAELARLAPMHTQVMQMRLEYAADQGRRAIINEYLKAVFENQLLPLTSDDVVLVAGMMLDDVSATQKLAEKILAERRHDPMAMIGRNFGKFRASARAEVARYLAQGIEPLVYDDPMRWPEPPAFEAWDHRQQVRALAAFGQKDLMESSRLLRGSLYLPWSFETTLSMLTAASQRWPEDARLKQYAARVSLWLGKTLETSQWLEDLAQTAPDSMGALENAMAHYLSPTATENDKELASTGGQGDSTWQLLALLQSLKQRDMAKVTAQMTEMFRLHPRAEPALLWIVRQMYDSGQLKELDALLEEVKANAPLLVQIAQSRILIATDRVSESPEGLSMVGVDALADSTIRWQQTEIEVLAALGKEQSVSALAMMETLSLSLRSLAPAIGLGQVSLMIDADRDRTAASIIMQQLSDPLMPEVWTDHYLARAMYLIDPDRILRVVDRNLLENPENSVLLYYRTLLLSALGRKDDSRQSLEMLVQNSPHSSRTLLLQARTAMEDAKLPLARSLLQQMIDQGGESQLVASRYMSQLASAPEPSTTAVESTP